MNHKTKKKSIMPALLFALSVLISTFCSEMNLVKKVISVVLKRGGAKKRLFNSLSNLNICMSYRSTNTLFKSFGKDFDLKLKEWKNLVELDTEMERKLCKNLSQTDNTLQKETLQAELNKHKSSMHPGYQFVGDNVDFIVKVRHMSSRNQNKDHHLFNCVAYKNRLSGNNLSYQRHVLDFNDYNLSELLPTVDDNQILLENLTHHVMRIWTENIPTLKFCEETLAPYISHRFMAYTKRKTEKVILGVLPKNETKIDDMVEICQFLHKYVPTCRDGEPVKCLSGGDYLTFERHKKAQSTMQDSRTASERLEGLQAKFEEFHTQAEVNKVVWNLLYNTASAADIGTLYAARNAVDARNVTKDPGDNFYAASSLLDKYTEALVIAGGLMTLNLDSISGELVEEDRQPELIKEKAIKFIKDFCIPEVPDSDIETSALDCTLCGRKY
ncbi:uncharacterized protein LOC132739445, partial [Ruditapes philippinarum]|uniref:uncharacterized protein LOC132739445 n=1 Tax=Ruditapes philippinarum TaxID=129788 RepID=UPI00295BAA46